MLRVVIDTNVIVSALNFGGNPKNVLELARKNRIQNITSPFIIDEVKKVLRQKFSWQMGVIREILTDFKTFSNIIDPPETLTAVSHLPDNRILECAVVGGADYLISGDRHLIDLKAYGRIKIVTPTEFLTLFI
jgi:uncharacterized protein